MPGTKTTAAVSRGPTRLQLSLQHAAADREGGSPSVGQWIQFRNPELAESVAGSGSDVRCAFLFTPLCSFLFWLELCRKGAVGAWDSLIGLAALSYFFTYSRL